MRSLTTSIIFCLGLSSGPAVAPLAALSGLTAGLAGCGSTPIAAAPEGPDPVPPELRADELDGLDGLTWGTPRAELERRFPGSHSEGEILSWMGTYTARAANITFHFDDSDQLESILVDFQSSYASMDACGVDWRAVRSDMNRFHGPSQSDNLAAYWTTDTQASSRRPEGLPMAIELSCNPGAADDAALSVRFARPTAD